MGKSIRKIADPLGLPDPLDLWGDKAAQAQKDAKEAADKDRAALTASQSMAPTLGGDDVAAARDAERARKLALSGQSSTILTSAGGASTSNTGQKTLLGQ